MNRILIVEDEITISRLIAVSLRRAGYDCTVANDGSTAADLIAEHDFDLALLDIMLPGLDGYELLGYLRPLGVPVIFITAKGATKDRVRGLQLGADDYIVKPFEIEELLARVEAVLRRTGRGGQTLTAFDVTMDIVARTVTRQGKAVELTPLTEGVTPDGSGISVSYITKELAQYGDYTTVSDMLDLTAIDDVVLEITDRHGANMGLTLDTVTRNEIQQGKQVLYAPAIGADGRKTEVTTRGALTAACRLTSEMVAKAATQLKKMNAPTFDGKYVCILHPSVAFDLRQDEAWIAAHQYAAATELFSGEIGELHGVRFVETTEAKIFRGEDLAQNGRTLLVNGKVENSAVVAFDGGTVAAGALAGRYVLLGGERRRVVSNTGSSMTLDSAVTAADNAVIYPGEGGAEGCAVYGCLFVGKGAYGVVDLNDGTEVIVKPRGSSGTADPLDQRSSVGWKGVHAAAILYDEYIVRVECGSSYSGQDKAN